MVARGEFRVLTLANNKGGVGKTGSTVSIAGAYSEMFPDRKVLVIDADPQGNSSKALGYRPIDFEVGSYHLFTEKKVGVMDAMNPTSIPNLFVVPADMSLRDFQIDQQVSGGSPRANFILKEKLDKFAERAEGDWMVIIDTRPDFDVYTLNALIASHRVLIPVTPCEFALDGFKYMINTISHFMVQHNPKLSIMGAFRSKWEKTNSHNTIRIEKDLQSIHSDFLISVVIPSQVGVPDSIQEGVPVNYNKRYKNSGVSNAFKELTKEILERWPHKLRVMGM